MQEVSTKTRVLRCPCGARMQASDDAALCKVLAEHVTREHPYEESPTGERVKEMVCSAVYGFEYVPAGAHDNLQEQGFGPEPY